jgi:cytochrome c biogenesis protein CcmG, thiol:disulfide interchange protein DsbE
MEETSEPPATEPSDANPESAAPSRRFGPARIVLGLAVAAAAVALFWPRAESERHLRPGGFLIDAAGRPQPLARSFRQVTLVHFWATWCPPCLTEIPSLLGYARSAVNDRLGIVLVAVADDPGAARRFVGDTDLPLLFDPGWDVAHRFGTEKLPETHVVVDGEVVDSFIGATDWSDPAVRARIQKWTATPTSASP